MRICPRCNAVFNCGENCRVQRQRTPKCICPRCVRISKDTWGKRSVKSIMVLDKCFSGVMQDVPTRTIIDNYDRDADVLYTNFYDPPIMADDASNIGGYIIRYKSGIIIGITLLDALKRCE